MVQVDTMATFSTLLIVISAVCFSTDHGFVSTQYAGARDRVRINPNRGYKESSSKLARSVVRGDQPPPADSDSQYGNDPEEIHPLTELATQWNLYPNRLRGYTPIKLHPCEKRSCYPATGNLLIGRESQLTTSSTCGLYERQRYCIVSDLENPVKCFWCDSSSATLNRPDLNHRISNIIYSLYPGTRNRSWWQSENGKENVTIQLDLEAEFHFTHLVIVFKTFRPAAMFIERSYDFGQTWKVYRYFAANCQESFPGVRTGPPQNLTDVVCEPRYSAIDPSSGGEVIFRVLPPSRYISNPYSPEVQNLIKMTNLRINFTKLHKLGDDLLDKREEIQAKYYYAISEMIVRGSCSCYGHANRCLPLPGNDPISDMVYGRCECTHNTRGRNCEKCEDFFNNLPWQPAVGNQTNACERCNCNNHATSCHFDPAVYQLSGNVSGGVCDGCMHNTMGINCEMCKQFFYRDPLRDIQDPEVCRPCDCDPDGSLEGGVCDSMTDPANNLEAGSCHCRNNVEGKRCDRCKNGFWNFDKNNPDGCEPCTCNVLGTIGNNGCNVQTGECTCKRYVIGRNCSQCLPEYWGLSNDRDGCKPCDCDPGGSVNNFCDVWTGQCKCRDNVQGRTCNKPIQNYYTASLDFYLYEAEAAHISSTCQIVIREPYRDGRENTWTGPGFVRTFEKGSITFNIDDIQRAMEYDIIIRYDPQVPGTWENVTLYINRSEPIDPALGCRQYADNDVRYVQLPHTSRSVVVYPPVCFEPGKTYTVTLQFNRFNPEVDSPTSSVLIDSIVIVPRIDQIEMFTNSPAGETHRQEYELYHCGQYFYNVNVKKSQIPEVCQKYHNSVGLYVYKGAFPCECDPTGSPSAICDEYGGNCVCRPNVIGRRCNACAPGTYGFGPDGCRACDCNSIGALDNFCDVTTGQCKCRSNTYGRKCDSCQPGYWNFPNCQRCECNGHADSCNSRTGACENCLDHTAGHYCEKCEQGYYGIPQIGYDIPCRPCPCPGVNGSGHSFADHCELDRESNDVRCECKEGYAGLRCDVCADNHYGNPEVPGGSCQLCNCSNKIDITRPNNCDPHTGVCLQCLNNTEGDHCEVCKNGYYKINPNDECTACDCSILGTNSSEGPCDKTTGQCHCLPNVVGNSCSECADNHWKIASGKGCEPCNCDPIGSSSPQCHKYYGTCECYPGFGGDKCNQCQENYWGDPRNQCFECRCDLQGSQSLQCHRDNGSCVCITGVGGYRCDVCDRGFIGVAPVCRPCGECFDNWDRIIGERKEETLRLIDEARNIKQTGATGAYTSEFEEMEKQIQDIKDLLDNTSISNNDIGKIEKETAELKARLKADTEKDDYLQEQHIAINQNLTNGMIALRDLEKKNQALNESMMELKNNATSLQEENVGGALQLVQEARGRASNAVNEASKADGILFEANRTCKRTELNLNRNAAEFNETQLRNDLLIQDLRSKLVNLNESIPEFNEKLCDRGDDSYDNPCDSLCGGAGCGFCGGVACERGAVKKAEKALNTAEETDNLIKKKEAEADELIRALSQIKSDVNTALNLSKLALNASEALYNETNSWLSKRDSYTEQMNEFLNKKEGTPAEIRTLVNQTLSKNITLRPEEITNLANKINETLQSVTNIDKIIRETALDLEKANDLKRRADVAKKDATEILETVERVLNDLRTADEALSEAKISIDDVKTVISSVKNDVAEIAAETTEARGKSNETTAKVESLMKRFKTLQQNIVKNNIGAKEVENGTKALEEEAEKTKLDARNLRDKYVMVKNTLKEKTDRSESTRTRAQDLLKRASQLRFMTEEKLKELTSMQTVYQNHEQNLKNLTDTIDKLNKDMEFYVREISTKSDYYRMC